ncbi:cellulose biosynthesis protein BcsD [Phenylobacterium aquaticum]|uniref:cellulose biosynthesis protein BcsD n=1 Tax=Phenylobacterium aquaticum TaxID=1763816 RepID=UPI0026EB15DC|nr:cellulose biosynthesis protein BcsD [Phenylobacterium aquaticum]
MTQSNDTVISYYADRQVSAQWRGTLAAIAAELFENVGVEPARGFLRQTGLRLAASSPLGTTETLEGFQVAANQALAAMDWGLVALSDAGEAVMIRHEAGPWRISEDASGAWPAAFAALLEGLYTGWLRAQGAGEVLAARIDLEASEQAVVLRFAKAA